MGKAVYPLAGEPEAGVLPVAVGVLQVDIPIRQVDAAAVRDLVIHDEHLAVVAVVGRSLQGEEGIERHAGNALLCQLPGVAEVEGGDAAQIVVHHPHVHALPQLVLQHLHHGVPHLPRLDDEILDVDGALGAFHITQHIREHIVSQRIVPHRLGLAQGIPGFPLQPADGLLHALFPRKGRLAHRERMGITAALHTLQPLFQRLRRPLIAEKQVQQRAHQRHRQDDEQPQQLVGALVPLDDDEQHHKDRRHRQQRHDQRRIGGQPLHQQNVPQHLQGHGGDDDQHTAHDLSHVNTPFLLRLLRGVLPRADDLRHLLRRFLVAAQHPRIHQPEQAEGDELDKIVGLGVGLGDNGRSAL